MIRREIGENALNDAVKPPAARLRPRWNDVSQAQDAASATNELQPALREQDDLDNSTDAVSETWVLQATKPAGRCDGQ
jgi:hypothetical protein